jgi:hypothetical protein
MSVADKMTWNSEKYVAGRTEIVATQIGFWSCPFFSQAALLRASFAHFLRDRLLTEDDEEKGSEWEERQCAR